MTYVAQAVLVSYQFFLFLCSQLSWAVTEALDFRIDSN